MWNLLIFRDNWQGEFCVALFGAIGWATISLLAPGEALDHPQYRVIGLIMTEDSWAIFFYTFGIMQLIGLFNRVPNASWFRAVGATGVFVGMLSLALALVAAQPWLPGLSFYMACIAIEFCAIVFQVARIVRFREIPQWPLITKLSKLVSRR